MCIPCIVYCWLLRLLQYDAPKAASVPSVAPSAFCEPGLALTAARGEEAAPVPLVYKRKRAGLGLLGSLRGHTARERWCSEADSRPLLAAWDCADSAGQYPACFLLVCSVIVEYSEGCINRWWGFLLEPTHASRLAFSEPDDLTCSQIFLPSLPLSLEKFYEPCLV